MIVSYSVYDGVVTEFSQNVPVALAAAAAIMASVLIAYFVMRFVRRAAR
jgi:hypothetical protein